MAQAGTYGHRRMIATLLTHASALGAGANTSIPDAPPSIKNCFDGQKGQRQKRKAKRRAR